MVGFPATLQATYHRWPFGLMYFLETCAGEETGAPNPEHLLEMSIYPRYGRGLFSIFTRIVLFESKGMSVRDKKLESMYIFGYNDTTQAERLVKYPGFRDNLERLHDVSRFSELQIRSNAGIYMHQPKSFAAVDLDVCRESFKLLGEIGQVIFECF